MPVSFNIEKLNTHSKRVESFSKTTLVNSETNTRSKLIDPLIELLGWDLRSTEVILEYPIKMGSRKMNVDYALSIDGHPIAFIEAKPFNSNLFEEYSEQIISYCRVEGIKWAGLSNGRQLKILDAKGGKREEDCIIAEIDLKNPAGYRNELSILHKESLVSGESEKLLKGILKRKETLKKIRESKDELIQEYSKVLSGVLGPDNNQIIEDVSGHLARTTINLIEEEYETASPETDVPESPGEQEDETPGRIKRDWNMKLEWANPDVKTLILDLKNEVEKLPNVGGRVSGSHYLFYKNQDKPTTRFVAMVAQKKRVAVRVKYDPKTSKDPSNLLKEKVYRWFFRGKYQERETYLEDRSQFNEILDLIKQAYNLI